MSVLKKKKKKKGSAATTNHCHDTLDIRPWVKTLCADRSVAVFVQIWSGCLSGMVFGSRHRFWQPVEMNWNSVQDVLDCSTLLSRFQPFDSDGCSQASRARLKGVRVSFKKLKISFTFVFCFFFLSFVIHDVKMSIVRNWSKSFPQQREQYLSKDAYSLLPALIMIEVSSLLSLPVTFKFKFLLGVRTKARRVKQCELLRSAKWMRTSLSKASCRPYDAVNCYRGSGDRTVRIRWQPVGSYSDTPPPFFDLVSSVPF